MLDETLMQRGLTLRSKVNSRLVLRHIRLCYHQHPVSPTKTLHGYTRTQRGKRKRSTRIYNDAYVWIREAVDDALSSRPIGSFLVRRPTTVTAADTYVLSIRVPKYMKRSCVVHYLLDRDDAGYRLRVSEVGRDTRALIELDFAGNEKGVSNIELVHRTSLDRAGEPTCCSRSTRVFSIAYHQR